MEDSKGFFIISRKLKESWLYPSNENRKFTKYEAWIWIIENARFCCSEPILLNGKFIIIPRGYMSITVEYLSKIFNWDKRTTEKFLSILEQDEKIRRFKINKKDKRSYTLLKINNYNEYQPKIYDVCNSKYKSKCHLNCKCCKEETPTETVNKKAAAPKKKNADPKH